MNDCTNAEIRDQLPDLLHERLDGSARALVLAHLDGCVDCRDELRLLGEVRSVIDARTPRVDLDYVIEALPKPPARQPLRLERGASGRRVWADWRVAAAVTLLVAGGSSVALLSRDQGTQSPQTTSAQHSVAAVPQAPNSPLPSATHDSAPANDTAAPSREPQARTEVAASAPPAAAMTETAAEANLSNLSESQLKALLQDIDHLKAVPVAEPEPVSLRLNTRTTGDIS